MFDSRKGTDMNREKIFFIRLKHVINGVVHQVPVVSCTLGEALEKVKDYPYNTHDDFVVLDAITLEAQT